VSVYTAWAFWTDGCRRAGKCTCGQPVGHMGWLSCFREDVG